MENPKKNEKARNWCKHVTRLTQLLLLCTTRGLLYFT